MGFLIGTLTFILVVNCVVLMLLILIQLPKKDAGAGTAFGGGTTDALFGAGTGNALTNLTKYAATIFFVLSIGLSMLSVRAAHRRESGLLEALQKQGAKAGPSTPGAPAATLPAAPTNLLGNLMVQSNTLSSTPPAVVESTNKPAAPAPAKSGK
jgi:preprotein translocase subunit SecG